LVSGRSIALDIDLATSRAQSIKRLAKGLSVRFFTVVMPAAMRAPDNFTGKIFSPARFALNCAVELGNNPTNRPPAMSVTVS
jgi:hypothetical protein